jgi:glycosyltransferase involved in cell wall biosynthesis
MRHEYPSRALISGGAPAGGLSSFAEGLRAGFQALGIPAEVVAPGRIFTRWRDLRDPDVLKILSTSAVFTAPFARRSICVAHGFPRADVHGWIRLVGIVLSLKLANRFSQLTTVSNYSAVHLQTVFDLRVDAVIHNPLHALFQEGAGAETQPRDCITYVGRLHPAKRLDRIFPAICSLVEETPGLRACIIGDGPLRDALEAEAHGNPRVQFTGPLPAAEVRAWLRRTRVFVSGCETEALGIAYLEALSQGCVVAMPACGGGLEIAPGEIGRSIRLLPLPLDHGAVLSALRVALSAQGSPLALAAYQATAIAMRYLEVDHRLSSQSGVTACSAALHGGSE